MKWVGSGGGLGKIGLRLRSDPSTWSTTLRGSKGVAAGYHVKLIFLGLSSADLAVARVRARVAQGGHDVAEAIIRRRFDAGLRNFKDVYRRLVESWALYDNSARAPRLLITGDNL